MPTRQQRQDDSGPATQAFLKWIEGPHAVPESPDLQDFVPSGAVFEYLNHDNRLASILTETFSSSDDRPSAHVILEKHCQVFAILVAIGSAELIRECIPFPALKDEKLPFTNRPTNFPHDTRDGGFGRRRAKDNLFARFQRWQPHFCAPKIEQQHGYRLDSDSILPYVEKDDIGRGASSIVYKVAIHSRHDGLKAANGVPSTHADHRQYALKVYQGPDSQRNCQDEVKAFRALGQTGLEATGIIGHYGSYVYKDQYHLVLEHADLGDLERIVARESPPSVDDEIVAFWESIFAIVSAVVRIHDLQDGVHQDIKMSNVLVKSRRNSRTLYEAAFGLTDLGTMRHRDHTTGDRTIDNHGVKAYGAPECHRDDTFDDSRRFANTAAADIFSLGCLLSELSVWVVFGVKGPHGLQGYREERIAGHGDEVRGQDSFHCRGENGRELLPAVTAAHDKLLRAGKCDSTTKAIVELLPELLAIEPEDRPSAKSLRHRLNLLIKKAKSKLSEAHPRTSVQTPPNWRPESDAVSTPASPTPDRQSARSFVNRPKAVSLATPGIHSDGYGFHADHTDLATMVDSPRAMTLMETRIQPHSRATEHLLDSVSASLDLGNQHPDDAAVHRRASRRDDTRGLPVSKSYGPSNSRTAALESTRRETLPARILTYLQPEHRSTTSTSGNAFSSEPGSMDKDPDDFSAPTLEPIYRTHTSVVPASHTVQPAHRRSDQSPSLSRSGASPVPGALPPLRTRHPSSTPESAGIDSFTPTSVPAPIQSAQTSHRPHGPGSSSPETSPLPQATVQSRRPPKYPVFLDYGTAAEYMDRTKRKERCLPLPGVDFMLQLKNRDHVFVMDNSKSMYEIHAEDKRLGRKPNHLELVRLLGWLTKSMDPNGVDLHYFSAAKKYQTEPLTNCKKSTDMENSLRAAKCTNTTTPNLEVGRLLVDYRQRLADYRQSARGSLRRIAAKVTGLPRPLSLYILTDGVWETPSHKGGGYLETEIKMLVQELIAAGLPRQQVGIQFIRFGSHEFGKQRLDHLDHLKKALKLGCDIVDTEPVEGGNIWKMLLGAINENFDDDDNEDDDDDHGHQALHGPAVSTIPVSGS